MRNSTMVQWSQYNCGNRPTIIVGGFLAIDALYFYEAVFVTCAVSKLVHTVLSSEINNILTPTQKNTPDT